MSSVTRICDKLWHLVAIKDLKLDLKCVAALIITSFNRLVLSVSFLCYSYRTNVLLVFILPFETFIDVIFRNTIFYLEWITRK